MITDTCVFKAKEEIAYFTYPIKKANVKSWKILPITTHLWGESSNKVFNSNNNECYFKECFYSYVLSIYAWILDQESMESLSCLAFLSLLKMLNTPWNSYNTNPFWVCHMHVTCLSLRTRDWI